MVGLFLAHVFRNSSEPKYWKTPIGVVRFHYIAYICYSGFVLVWRTHEVKTGGLRVVSIASCVVDCAHQRNLPSRSQIVYELRCLNYLELLESNRSTFRSWLAWPFLDFVHLKDYSINFTYVFCDCSNFYFCIHFWVWKQGQGNSVNQSLRWIWVGSFERFSPSSVNSSIKLELHIMGFRPATSTDCVATVRPIKLNSQCLVWLFGRFSSNNNLSVLVLTVVKQVCFEGLSLLAHDTSQRSLGFANHLRAVCVSVFHYKLDVLWSFEVVVHFYGRLEVRIQSVVDHFCFASFNPLLFN